MGFSTPAFFQRDQSSARMTNGPGAAPSWGWPFAPNNHVPQINRERRCYIVTLVSFIFIVFALVIGIIFGLQRREDRSVPNGQSGGPNSGIKPFCCSRDGTSCSLDFENICPDQNTCVNTKCQGQWIQNPAANSNQCCSNDGTTCSQNLSNQACNNDATTCSTQCQGSLIQRPNNNNNNNQNVPGCCAINGSCPGNLNNCDRQPSVCNNQCGGQFLNGVAPPPAPGQPCCTTDNGNSCNTQASCNNQNACINQCGGQWRVVNSNNQNQNACCSSDGGATCSNSFTPFCNQSQQNCAQCAGQWKQGNIGGASAVNTSTQRYQQFANIFRSGVSSNNPNALGNPSTAQAKACHWVANVDPLQVQQTDTVNLNARYSLAVHFYATEGERWFNSFGWLSSSSHCTWYGISCSTPVSNPNTPGNVVSIDLERNNMKGPIANELFAAFGSTLVDLDMNSNMLNGTIPTNTISALSTLQVMSLYNNTLVGSIPAEIGNMGSIQKIYLEQNQLTNRIPDQVGNLANLERLDLFQNQLFGSVPSTIGRLANLQRLWLSNNSFWGNLPTQLGDLTNLQELYIDENLFNGVFPDSIGNLNRLRDLRAYSNNFQGTLPRTLGQLVNLEIMYMDNNRFVESIPNEIGFMSRLRELSLFNNTFTGPIPPTLGQLVNLQVLSLSRNQLSGPIPPNLNQLSQLTVLHLYNNTLQGTVPNLSGMAQLRDMFLYNNQLNGPLPSFMNSLQFLDDVNLSFNQFQGSIPAGVASPSMSTLILNGNPGVTGNIPQQICDYANIQTIVVDCQIQGCYTRCV